MDWWLKYEVQYECDVGQQELRFTMSDIASQYTNLHKYNLHVNDSLVIAKETQVADI